jgi:hypothetical protein
MQDPNAHLKRMVQEATELAERSKAQADFAMILFVLLLSAAIPLVILFA